MVLHNVIQHSSIVPGLPGLSGHDVVGVNTPPTLMYIQYHSPYQKTATKITYTDNVCYPYIAKGKTVYSTTVVHCKLLNVVQSSKPIGQLCQIDSHYSISQIRIDQNTFLCACDNQTLKIVNIGRIQTIATEKPVTNLNGIKTYISH